MEGAVLGVAGYLAISEAAAAVVVGVAAGAVVGGVVSAIQGGDILKGALVGGLIGGVTAGIGVAFSGAGEAAAGAAEGAEGATAATGSTGASLGGDLAEGSAAQSLYGTSTATTGSAITSPLSLSESTLNVAGNTGMAGAGGGLNSLSPLAQASLISTVGGAANGIASSDVAKRNINAQKDAEDRARAALVTHVVDTTGSTTPASFTKIPTVSATNGNYIQGSSYNTPLTNLIPGTAPQAQANAPQVTAQAATPQTTVAKTPATTALQMDYRNLTPLTGVKTS